MNQVNVIGRLGADIELRYTPAGKAVCEMNLAVDDGWGENKKTVWLGVTVWGATAELAAKALSKGSRVGITGRLSQEEWEDKNTGKKQRKTKVTCQDMHLLEPKRDSQPAPQPTRHEAAKVNAYQPQPVEMPDGDEIPF
jgi:single-strand DNA-binding protein